MPESQETDAELAALDLRRCTRDELLDGWQTGAAPRDGSGAAALVAGRELRWNRGERLAQLLHGRIGGAREAADEVGAELRDRGPERDHKLVRSADDDHAIVA